MKKKTKKRKYDMLFYLGIIFSAISIAFMLIVDFTIGIVFLGLGIVYIVLGIIRSKKKKK